jgi:hypothetical protein
MPRWRPCGAALTRYQPVCPRQASWRAPALACPVSSDAGWSSGFALFPARFDPVRRVRHERGIVMGSEREPEQFENPAADLLLRLSKSLRVRDHQLVCVPRVDALQTVGVETNAVHTRSYRPKVLAAFVMAKSFETSRRKQSDELLLV